MNTEQFIANGYLQYNGLDTYESTCYINSTTPVFINCCKHGEYKKIPSEYNRGYRCSKCALEKVTHTQDHVIAEFRKIWGDQCNYTRVKYEGNKKDIEIGCNLHDVWYWQTPANHKKYMGCPECRKTKTGGFKRKLSTEEVVRQAKIIHGDKYDYSISVYRGYNNPMNIRCIFHDRIFSQKIKHHLSGSGCPLCANKSIGDANRDTKEKFIADSTLVHGDKYDYDEVEYLNLVTPVKIKCRKCGPFMQRPDNHKSGSGCPSCVIISSDYFEKEIVAYINNDLNIKCKNTRTILDKHELDIWIEDRNIAFEADGVYWHSELSNKKDPINYHLNKTLECNSKNITLYHIFEDEWKCKENITKSYISQKLGCSVINTGAICELNSTETINFLESNYLFKYTSFNYSIGLKNKDNDIVFLVTFRIKNNTVYLLEICRKLFSDVSHEDFNNIINYIESSYGYHILFKNDRRWNEQLIVDNKNFNIVDTIPPQHWYFARSYVQRFKPIECKFFINNYDESLPEEINMKLNNYYRIWDCGYDIYELR